MLVCCKGNDSALYTRVVKSDYFLFTIFNTIIFNLRDRFVNFADDMFGKSYTQTSTQIVACNNQ